MHVILRWLTLLGLVPVLYAAPTLTVSKAIQGGATSVKSGTSFTYVINWANPSTTEDAHGVVLTDVLPSQLSWASSDVSFSTSSTYVTSATYNSTTGTLNWTFADPFPAGTSGQFTVTVKFSNGTTPNGTVAINTANLSQTGGATASSSPVSITATAAELATASKSVTAGGAVGNNIVYNVKVSNPSTSGGLNLNNVTIVDTLPTGAVFVSATGGGVVDGTGKTVTWTQASLNINTTFSQYVVVNFPTPTFAAGQTVINSLSAVGTPVGATSPVTLTASVSKTLTAAGDTTVFTKTASKSAPVINSDTISYTMNPKNTGSTPLSNFQIVDVIPAGLVVSSIQIDPTSSIAGLTAGTVTLEYSTTATAPYTWTTVTGTPGTAFVRKTSGFTGTITAIRWTFSSVPVGWSGNSVGSSAGSGFSAKVAAGVADATVISNCASYSYQTTYGTTTTKTGSNCVDVTTSNGLTASLNATKYAPSPSAVNPGTTVTYTIGAKAGTSTASIINPVLADLLPTGMTYVANSWAVVTGSPTPTSFESIDNYNGTGRTLLRWRYTASVTTTEIKLTFKAVVPAAATGGTSYSNTSYIVGWDNATVTGASTTDTNDLNGNGSKTDTIAASSSVSISVNTSASLNSVKSVIGQLDVDYSKYPATANSVPGGVANYRLTVQNSGDVPLKSILIIDILPFVGDTGVVDTKPRNSVWRPYLASTVTAPSGVVVYYSTAKNPSRPEMGVTTSQPANWSTVPPSDITTVQSLKFDFGTKVLGPLDQLELDWQMRVPPDAPTDGSVAWNSFGVVATRTDNLVPFLPTEPIKVGIAAQPIKPAAFGDFVWNDSNRNGIQDTGETGLDAVRVELYNHTGAQSGADPTADTYVGFTLTSGGGKYLFSNLDPGKYYAVFYTPTTYLVSPTSQGSDRTKDSDGTSTTVNGFPATITPIYTLNSGDVTLNADQGFYQPTTKINAVGNYVWNDINADGIQNESSADGINGVTVQLYTSTGTLVTSTTTANDLNGSPGYYLFDGLANGSYYLKFVLPTGNSFTTQSASGSTSTTDSDAIASGANAGKTATFALNGGQYDSSWDAGLKLPTGPMSLGDFVWLDTNGNGLVDSGESGINNIKLNLYKDTDGNGSYTTGVDQFVTTTRTFTQAGAPGYYSFANLPVGTYIVQVDPANFVAGSPLFGFNPSGPQPPPSSDTDIDDDNNGLALANSGIVASVVTLTLNGEPGPGGNNNNGTVDFGFTKPVTIGDFVWVDTNGNGVQDGGEPGINGVKLTLIGTTAAGVSITDYATTSGNGAYSFSEPPGTYTVTVDASNSTGSGVLVGYSPTATSKGTTSTDSNVNPSATTPSTLASGSTDSTIDFGYYKPVTIGDFVWVDTNGNGVQDSGEPGINGVTLTLTGTSASGASVTDQATTSGNGVYTFSEPPGTYTVTVDASNFTGSGALVGYAASATSKGTASTDSNTNPSGTSPTTLTSGTSDSTIDFGYYKPVTIGDFVWVDTNGNGVQDSGEPGINGVTLTLTGTSASGASVTDYATTSGNGAYSFSEPPGTYTVTVDASNAAGALAGYRSTETGKGTTATDSNVSPSATTPTVLTSGATDSTIDFGYYKPVTIGDFVWVDSNGNGVQDSGEPGINGVTLTLSGTSASGAPITDHATTSGNGAYSFSEPPGTYTVTVDASNTTGVLAGYIATAIGKGTTATDNNGSPSPTTPSVLTSGATDSSIDFGYYKPVTIGDFVWVDTNGNGVQDGSEPGINGVTLTLSGISASGVPITAQTTTSGNGGYSFIEPPGTYTVTVDAGNATGALAGYTTTATGRGTTATDSNVNPSATSPLSLISGAIDSTIDFGYYKPVTIGDFVWVDTNGNGVQDGSEPGINGVTLTLSGTTAAGAPITEHATTSGNGAYSFSEPPGTYTVSVDASNATGALAGYSSTATGKGTTATDSNGSPSATTPTVLTSGATDSTIDFGYYKPVTIGDFVWVDSNGNGVQDPSEPGINGVTLTLSGTSASGAPITDHATTSGNGTYSFSEAPGTYTVTVDAANASGALAGYSSTATGKGTTATDSNGSPSATTPTVLTSGATDSTIDFGYYKPVTIGDFVWVDTNGNGVQDSGEPGINGVTLTLSGTSGSGAPITDHATTSGNGAYTFTEPPGTYKVAVDASNTATVLAGYSPTASGLGATSTDSNTNPSGTTPGTLASGASDNSIDFGYYKPVTIGNFVWVDSNGNGVQDSGELGIAGVVMTLTGTNAAGVALTNQVTTDSLGFYHFSEAPGTYLVTVDPTNSATGGALVGLALTATGQGTTDTDSNPNPSGTTPVALTSGASDSSLDFGYYIPVTIGDFVWLDANRDGVQDPTETGIGGVTLTLTGTTAAGDSKTDHATTDSNGHYQFSEPPGTYTVTVDDSNSTASLSGYVPTVTGQGTSDTDSNIDPSGTTPDLLLSGGSDSTIDFGYIVAPPTAARLSSFTAQRVSANATEVEWRALADSDVIGFLVERRDSTGWVRVTSHLLPLIGNGRTPKTYSLSDSGGASAYHLLAVDRLGNTQVIGTAIPNIGTVLRLKSDTSSLNIQLFGTPKADVGVESSTDLTSGNWIDAGSIQLDATGAAVFTARVEKDSAKRFYRFTEK